ncbi:amidase [Sorangium cellulosum]|uniref:Amidase n=2 Tax=Sorangium cellulosum TaxID=56 RepID=A0A2L0EMK1_SORCE|nr:amidase [Sorangium cellulosum]
MMSDATRMLEALETKTVSARELAMASFARIEALDGRTRAIVATDREGALSRAAAIDDARARGEPVGPLAGLPLSVKDALCAVGMPTTSGARELASHRPAEDAPSVARLRAAGAVLVAKTNLPKFAGDIETENELFGRTNNPWDLTRTPGGSSGGSAVALAMGFSAIELGSDLGGSMRTPCHFNGVFGHKPSHALVPTRGHITGPLGRVAPIDLGVVGPMARSARDLDRMLAVLAGPDPIFGEEGDFTLPAPRATDLRDFRVAAWLDDPRCPVDTAMRTVLEAAVDALERAGAHIDRKARPAVDLLDNFALSLSLVPAVISEDLPAGAFFGLTLASPVLKLLPGDAGRFARGLVQRHRDWLLTDERRHAVRVRWAEFFRSFDVVITPAAVTAAFPHSTTRNKLARKVSVDGVMTTMLVQSTWPQLATLAYLPATVVPVGRTADGLPVGAQVLGPYRGDRTTIAFAAAVERVLGGFEAPPLAGREPRANDPA